MKLDGWVCLHGIGGGRQSLRARLLSPADFRCMMTRPRNGAGAGISIENLAQYFRRIEDPRCSAEVERRPRDILVIAVCACGTVRQ